MNGDNLANLCGLAFVRGQLVDALPCAAEDLEGACALGVTVAELDDEFVVNSADDLGVVFKDCLELEACEAGVWECLELAESGVED